MRRLLLAAALPATLALAAAVPAPVPRPADPDACLPCHARQVEEWRTSAHAHAAASEGFLASIRRWGAPADAVADRCLACHVPGAADAHGVARALLAGQAARGVTCQACHGGSASAHPTRFAPRGGREDACAACHRWAPGGVACSTVYDGWRDSAAAAAGADCITCHMPERSHRFSGSRSVDMLARAATLRLRAERGTDGPVAVVEVRNLAGHRLPDG